MTWTWSRAISIWLTWCSIHPNLQTFNLLITLSMTLWSLWRTWNPSWLSLYRLLLMKIWWKFAYWLMTICRRRLQGMISSRRERNLIPLFQERASNRLCWHQLLYMRSQRLKPREKQPSKLNKLSKECNNHNPLPNLSLNRSMTFCPLGCHPQLASLNSRSHNPLSISSMTSPSLPLNLSSINISSPLFNNSNSRPLWILTCNSNHQCNNSLFNNSRHS